jgi:hypothetical protein
METTVFSYQAILGDDRLKSTTFDGISQIQISGRRTQEEKDRDPFVYQMANGSCCAAVTGSFAAAKKQ